MKLIVAVAAALSCSPAAVRAATIGTLVPAYFYPGTGGPGGVGDGWAAMAAAAAQIPLTAVFNPNSGPVPGPADPNYVNAITNLESAGGHAIAYVYTGEGSVPLSTVEGEINTYISQYHSLVQGFFVDGMSLAPSTLSYYQSINSYIKGLGSSYAVVGNPGNPRLHGVSPSDYLSTADVFDIFEGPSDPGPAGFADYPYGENWFEAYPRDRFSNIVYNVPAASLTATLDKAYALDAGTVYLTDLTGVNPYDQLPGYWNEEVAALASLTAVPEPETLAVLASGLPIAAGVRGFRRHRTRQRES